MTSLAPALPFPGGRTLAGWWRQLAGTSPDGLWVGHFLLHRVEALVRLARTHRLDPFPAAVLRAIRLGPDTTLDALDASLHLGSAVLLRLLRELEAEKLIHVAEGKWCLSETGQEALGRGEYARSDEERRVFHFIEPWEFGGVRGERAPHFLPVNEPIAIGPAVEGWDFDPAHLQACVGRPAEWKVSHGFPVEVQEVLTAAEGGPSGWRRVILDHREHFVAVFALVPAGSERRLLGFPVPQEGWVLESEHPAFTLAAVWQEVFPELKQEPSMDAWRQAWRSWCQPRSIPPAEYEVCRLERHGHVLKVVAPRRLVDRLRAARSDVLKGEAWLLAGTGSTRAAVMLELHET